MDASPRHVSRVIGPGNVLWPECNSQTAGQSYMKHLGLVGINSCRHRRPSMNPLKPILLLTICMREFTLV
jgi:hypothetical protein